jgi:hypothetical protein
MKTEAQVPQFHEELGIYLLWEHKIKVFQFEIFSYHVLDQCKNLRINVPMVIDS